MNDKHNIKISKHAVDKYIMETGCKRGEKYAEKRIREIFGKSVQVDLPSDIKIYRLLNNGIDQATYHERGQWRMVLVGGVMVTFERKYRMKGKSR